MALAMTENELAMRFSLNNETLVKKLIELNLRQKDNLFATDFAIKMNFAANGHAVLDGRMTSLALWTREGEDYIKEKTINDVEFCSEIFLGKTKDLKRIKDHFTMDNSLWNQFKHELIDLVNDCKNMEILTNFYLKLEKNNLLVFSENIWCNGELDSIKGKIILERELPFNPRNGKKVKI